MWRVPPLYPLTRAHEVDSATRWGRHQAAAADSIFREIRFGAAAIAASVSGATGSGRLGGAAAAGRRRHRGDDGARALVANAADELMMGAAAGRAQVRGHRQQAALKDQRFRVARSSSLSIDSRARGRQRDPLGPAPGRRRRFHFREIRFGAAAIAASVSGATGSGRLGGAAAAGRRRHRGDDGARALVANAADELMMGAAAGRALRGTGSSPTGGIERPAV